jgi:hypothetical protein
MSDVARRFPLARAFRRSTLALLPVLGLLLALASLSGVYGQQPDVVITELQCNADPELVTISNQGSNGQDLTGWSLRSDPVASEVFDLSALGTLAPGVTVTVQAGPSASGSFVWSQNFVLRDSDPADFARILDASGAVVHEVKCGSASPTQAATTAAPTTAPTVAPTAAPTAAPADGVPVGGGPPGGGSWGSAGVMLVAGAWLLAMTAGAVLVFRLRQRAAPALVAAGGNPVTRPSAGERDGGSFAYLLLVLLFAVLAALSFGSDDQRRRPS